MVSYICIPMLQSTWWFGKHKQQLQWTFFIGPWKISIPITSMAGKYENIYKYKYYKNRLNVSMKQKIIIEYCSSCTYICGSWVLVEWSKASFDAVFVEGERWLKNALTKMLLVQFRTFIHVKQRKISGIYGTYDGSKHHSTLHLTFK